MSEFVQISNINVKVAIVVITIHHTGAMLTIATTVHVL